MENSIGEVILLGVLILIVIALTRLNNTTGIDMISNDLRRKGAKPISISREWIDIDRNTMTYLVEYIDSNGNKISSHCKIRHIGLFKDKKLYWSDSVNLGASADFPATHKKVKQIKRNPSLSELKRESAKNSKKSINNTQRRTDNKAKLRGQNKVKGIE